MPVLIGELEKITGSPSSVTQVMVRAHKTRITGAALTTDELVPIPVDRRGRFEVPLRPGKAVLVLVHGGRVGEGERFPMLVEEEMGTITSAIKLASDRFDDYELDELERAAADMLASLDKGLVAATRAEVAQEGAENAKKGSEDARDKAGEHRDDAEKAAGSAAAEAADGAVRRADEKLSGYVTNAKKHAGDSAGSATAASKEADRAETARQGAETIEQNLPTKVGQEVGSQLPGALAKQLPAELDERVSPVVAEAIAEDRAVADAAAEAVGDALTDRAVDHFGGYKPASSALASLLPSGNESRVWFNVAGAADRPGGHNGTLTATRIGSQHIQVFEPAAVNETWQRRLTDRTHITPGEWAITDWERVGGVDAEDLDTKADTDYVDAADQALGQRITDGKWDQGEMPLAQDMNTWTTVGWRRIPFGARVNNMANVPPGAAPFPAIVVNIPVTGDGLGVVQEWYKIVPATATVQKWFRHRRDGVWSTWDRGAAHSELTAVDAKIAAARWYRTWLELEDLDTITTQGYRPQYNQSFATTGRHYPVAAPGVLETFENRDKFLQRYTTMTAPVEVYHRDSVVRDGAVVWRPWHKQGSSTPDIHQLLGTAQAEPGQVLMWDGTRLTWTTPTDPAPTPVAGTYTDAYSDTY